jgi:hypothetical protein
MNRAASVRVTVVVDVVPAVAFEVFTQETAAWYRPNIAGAPTRAGGHLRFDEVGRLVLRATEAGGDEVKIGDITVWEPGHRLVFVDRLETEVDVVFEARGEQTQVTLEHRGLDRLPPDDALSVAQYGWRRLAFQFEQHLERLRVRER